AIAGFLATARADRARRIDDQLGARLPPPSRWAVRIGDATHQVALAQDEVRVDGEVVDLAMEYTPGDRLIHAEVAGKPLSVK
ncbi:hypothetical protein ACKI1S_49395, partial [Streptomyces galilaeus]